MINKIIKYMKMLFHKYKVKNLNLGKKGDKVTIDKGFNFNRPENIYIDEYVYIGPYSTIYAHGKVSIKSGSIIGPNVTIYTANHNFKSNLTAIPYDEKLDIRPIEIDENVWIGGNVLLLPGTKIREGVIIGAGSVVSKEIPPFSIVVGNPATIIGLRDIDEYKRLKKNKSIYLINKYRGEYEKKQYKVAILGGYGLRNFGDDALMYILNKVMTLEYKESNIVYICTPDNYLRKIIKTKDIIDINSNYDLDTNILLYGGGTQFYSFRPKKKFIYRILLNIKNPFLLFQKLKKKILTLNGGHLRIINKTAALGIGVGPFLPSANKNIELNTKKLFLDMDFVGVRDTYSFNKCKEWGLNNIQQYADLCYLMDDEFKLDNKRNTSSIKKIGVIVRDWIQTDEGAAYYDKIIPLVSTLKQDGYEVNIVLFSQKRDLYWLEKLKDIDNVIIWDPDNNNIQDFLKILDNFDLFITARYHGAVFSSLLGKPFISIVVEQKLEMISDLYMDCSRKWAYPFEVKKCTKYVHEINQKYNKHKNNVISITRNQKELAQKMMNDFMGKI